MYREPIYSRSLRLCAPAVGVRSGKRDCVSANTERLEQFSSIGRSPIVKPFMPAGYARHFFFLFFSFGVGRPRSSPPPSAFPSCRSNVIVFGYSSFPLSRLLVSCAKAPLTLDRASSSPRYYDVTVPSFTLSASRVIRAFFSILFFTVYLSLPSSSSSSSSSSYVIPPSIFPFDRSYFSFCCGKGLRLSVSFSTNCSATLPYYPFTLSTRIRSYTILPYWIEFLLST